MSSIWSTFLSQTDCETILGFALKFSVCFFFNLELLQMEISSFYSSADSQKKRKKKPPEKQIHIVLVAQNLLLSVMSEESFQNKISSIIFRSPMRIVHRMDSSS